MTMTLQQAADALAAGQVSARSLTEQALTAAEDPQGEGARVFLRLWPEQARQAATQADDRRRQGQSRGPLDGLPISVKALFDVAGESTSGGSRRLAQASPAQQDAAAVARLRQAGAVPIGSTNMTEFAYSGLGINPHYGTPANRWQRERRLIPGGSSSGAAVAVSDGMCLGSLGSDTGGSVRIPAALCGLTGFKPTARRISMQGLQPLSPSLDSVGVIAHDVASCALLDGVVADRPLVLAMPDLQRLRLAVPQTLVLEGLTTAVAQAFYAAVERLKSLGLRIDTLPLTPFAELGQINAAGGLTACEAWQWHQSSIATEAHRYDPRVLSRIRRGAAISAKDAALLHRQRAGWQQRVSEEMAGYDALLMPTVPMTAPTVAELEQDEAHYFAVNAALLRNPSLVNFLDGCAVSLPCHPAGTAPVGLMLAALPDRDTALMCCALAVEQALRPLTQSTGV
ncbi:amidase [Erwinia persicina]|uniref:amidase n=1 Tax=Erwinia persicina TaxID=55211 RepID=UPI001783B150|nr:amidase [Erwinia persicina]MBD8164114.1 amidase [Erwinia persicina]